MKVFGQIVTYNSEVTIEECLISIYNSNFKIDFRVFDNQSGDRTRDKLSNFKNLECYYSDKNIGFAAAHNLGYQHAKEHGYDYYLCINPDIKFDSECIGGLVRALNLDDQAFLVFPKLLKWDQKTIDSVGMAINFQGRHYDRHQGEQDKVYNPAYVFGASGACFLIKNTLNEGLFDEDFFAYREDAELAFRLCYQGKFSRFEPTCVAYHLRKIDNYDRKQGQGLINRLGVRNRFLLQMRSLPTLMICHPKNLLRNLVVFFGVLFKEQSSLPGLMQAFVLLPKSIIKRIANFKNRVAGWPLIFFWARSDQQPAIDLNSIPQKRYDKVDVVIIDYNSGALLDACLKKLLAADDKYSGAMHHIAVYLISNGDRYYGEFMDQIQVLSEGINLGFAASVNLGLNLGGYTLILNPDIQIQSHRFRHGSLSTI